MTFRSSPLRHALRRSGLALTAVLLMSGTWLASAATPASQLADQPVFSTLDVPGNLALALSVEWPTASRTAHTDAYSSAATFLGYFDPNKCYAYVVNATSNDTNTGDTSYFNPVAAAVGRKCTSQWSGNFLNWAGTTTIDPFRWAMTGGRRVVDTTTETILEQGWHGNRGLFDDRYLPANEIAGATPDATASSILIKAANMGFKMRVSKVVPQAGRVLKGEYFQGTSSNYKGFAGAVTATVAADSADHIWNGASPAPGVNGEYFSARYTGTFQAPETGTYKFRTLSDDGVRLYINGALVINNWTDHGTATDTTGGITLLAGANFTVQLEFYQGTGGAQLQFLWNKPSDGGGYSSFVSTTTSATDYTMRVKVCSTSISLESNCVRYGSNYKPEGLIQKYSERMRFSAFGYLNDSSDQRDGGVMRAAQKFVGPVLPRPGQAPTTNTAEQEWSPTDGTFYRNPNSADAAATTTATGVAIADSGVINYLNKFGQLIPGDYKDYDPVSEMYYSVLRYYKNLGNVSSWSNMGTNDANTRRRYLDGFPVITDWTARDPVQYSCQRNFILGIGDIYTHVDKNVPGNTGYRTREPGAPDWTTETLNAVTATNRVGALQGLGNIGNTDNFSGRNNSAYIAGMAFDANTRDIRPDVTGNAKTIGKQTVQTYWVDVLEAAFEANNQFYLAAKFGGLKVPSNFDPDAFTGTIPKMWWSTSGDMVGAQDRPDNYYTAGRPDTMVAGLTKAFESIANAIKAFTTSFSLSTVQVSSAGAASYASQYDANGWTGTVSASEITFATDGTPTSTARWSTATTFETQLAGGAGGGWDVNRRIATWNGTAGVPFRTGTGGIGATLEASLATAYATGDSTADYLNYLRGDRRNEKTDLDATKFYRKRSLLLGDVVDAKVTPVGPPSMNYSDAVNIGYAAFKTSKSARPTMVYAAANDGMLHAFNGVLTGVTAGTEQFAYVPNGTFTGPTGVAASEGLAALGNPDYLHRFYVDSTPLVFDVDFNRAFPTLTTTTAANSDWRSVLIGGLGKGGKSFYAIDVTDPGAITSEATLASKILWEFKDTTMGFSFGAPTVVKTKKYGWVVILTSGYSDVTQPGYIYFVNPKTGELLEKVSTGANTEGLTHTTAYVQDFTDGTADAVYAGDLNGNLWRFDLTAPNVAGPTQAAYPVATKLATLKDSLGNAQPITTQPLVEIQPLTKKRFVMLGTGRLLNSTDVSSGAAQTFYAIMDGTNAAFAPTDASMPILRSQLTEVTDLATGVSLTSGTKGWFLELGSDGGVGLRLIASPTSFNGIVAFGALLTTGDACSPSGKSRVYAIDFGTGQTALTPVDGVATRFVSYDTAITDLKFIGVDRTARLVTGDVQGVLRNVGFRPPGSTSLRLLNWREVPTVD